MTGSVDQCAAALHDLAARLDGVDPALRRKHAADRTLSCALTDLAVGFRGRLSDGQLRDISAHPLPLGAPDAQIRLTTTSADLLALTEGQLSVASALASGRLRLDASMLDLLRLRSLL